LSGGQDDIVKPLPLIEIAADQQLNILGKVVAVLRKVGA